MSRREVDNQTNIIDSRDVIARLKELESDRDTNLETLVEHKERIAELEAMDTHTLEQADELARLNDSAIWTAEDGTEYADSADWDQQVEQEWKILKALNDECEDYASDWQHGETLIRDSYFENYARETAEELGLLENCDKWPATCIDWERAASELQHDYTSVDFDGETYWIRN